jgi:hypothetical protein
LLPAGLSPIIKIYIKPMLFLWLLPVIFIIHDTEEIIIMQNWLAANRPKLRPYEERFRFIRFALKFNDITKAQFTGAVFIELLVLAGVSALFSFSAQNETAKIIYLSFNTALFIHLFMHVGQSVILKSYTPGVITSIAVLIPGGILIYKFLLQWDFVNMTQILISIPIGTALIFPILFGSLFLSKKLIR